MTPLPPKPHNITNKIFDSPPSPGSNYNKLKRKSGSIPSAPPPPKPNKKRKLKPLEAAAETTMATQAAQDDQEIDYPAIRAWLARQESNPTTPLTSIQRRALIDLTRCIKVEEPPLGDKDYISLLGRKFFFILYFLFLIFPSPAFKRFRNQFLRFFIYFILNSHNPGYRDAHQTEGSTHIFQEDVAPNNPTKWICTCTFQGHRDSSRRYTFPSAQSVNPVTGEAGIPAFARKKDAKKYAAKCCVDWLMSERYMPSDGNNVAFPPGAVGVKHFEPDSAQVPSGRTEKEDARGVGASVNAPSSAARRTQELVAAQDVDVGGVRLDEGGAPGANRGNNGAGNGNKKGGASEIDVHDEDIPITKRVEAMCRRLGLITPRYIITPSPKDGNYYDGYADFGADACRIPEEVGRNEFVYSKTFTKIAIAEKVLKRLFEMEAERAGEHDELVDEVLRHL